MSDSTPTRRRRQIELLRAQFAEADGPGFADALPARRGEDALREEAACWRETVCTPGLPLWALLAPVAGPDGSCRAAVARVLAWLVARGQRPCRPTAGPYCKARARLPESLPRRLAREAGRDLHDRAEAGWLWQ